jgi:hypothetical protein
LELDTLILPLKSEDNAFRAGIARATQLVSGLVDFLGDCVTEASASEDALAQLNAVLKSTGGAAGVTAEMANELAEAFQATTKFSDEAVLSAESMLLTFTSVGKDVFPLATQTILDMSQALGQDLKSSAIQLGKALNDPKKGVTALQRVGVQFNEEQREMIDNLVESGDLMGAQTLILEELQKEFGGSAEAAGQTFGGQLEILKNRLSDVKEQIGGAIIPVLSTLGGVLMDVFNTPQFQAFMDTVLGGLEDIGKWVQNVGLPGFLNFGKALKKSFDKGGLVGVVDTLLDAFDELDLTKISQSLADGISSINWSQVGMDFSALVSRIGESIGDAFGEIDWLAVGNALASGLNNFIGGIFGTDEAGLQTIVKTGLANIQTELTTWAAGAPSALDGLDVALVTVVQNAMAGVEAAITEKLRAAGQRFSTWATTTVPGALNGLEVNITDKVRNALNGFETKVEEKLRTIAKTFFNRGLGWAQQAAKGFQDGVNTILGAVRGIVGQINGELRKIITSFTISVSLPDWLGGGGGTVGGGNKPPRDTCFIAGTLVTLADGTTKPIELIEVGDSVRSWDGGAFISAGVVDVFHHPPQDAPQLVEINRRLIATPEHLIYASGIWKPAGRLALGDVLLGDDVVVEKMERLPGGVPVYNLHTDHESHNYLANGVLVHNAKQQNASGGSFMVPSSYGWEGFNLGQLGTASGGEAIRIQPRGQELQAVAITNWDDFDVARLASEIVKALNN